MFITVAICTWNRAALLDQTLTAMHKLVIPEGVEWELLVVNNNCTDDTDNVIARHANILPIRGVHEPSPGQSNARNCAIGSARGELIIWTDDDVLVDPEWISAYSQAAVSYCDASFFGGQVLPWFEGRPPQWLKENWRQVECAFAVRDLGDESILFSPRVVPVGANFAVRTVVQRQYLYNPDLGYRPGSRLAGEDTTLMRQMLADGLQGRWVSAAKVLHYLPKNRQTTRYLLDWFQGYGEYLALMDGHLKGVHWFGKPRWLWRQVAMAGFKYYGRRLCTSPPTWLQDLAVYGTSRGQLGAYGRGPCLRSDRV